MPPTATITRWLRTRARGRETQRATHERQAIRCAGAGGEGLHVQGFGDQDAPRVRGPGEPPAMAPHWKVGRKEAIVCLAGLLLNEASRICSAGEDQGAPDDDPAAIDWGCLQMHAPICDRGVREAGRCGSSMRSSASAPRLLVQVFLGGRDGERPLNEGIDHGYAQGVAVRTTPPVDAAGQTHRAHVRASASAVLPTRRTLSASTCLACQPRLPPLLDVAPCLRAVRRPRPLAASGTHVPPRWPMKPYRAAIHSAAGRWGPVAARRPNEGSGAQASVSPL
ncbi:uncharacterized protein B0H18DRAFT_626292 [Fomitopsis serialis]|uniref:uncharacterized protein n=1 Tax=Fomitopsis serialis TaxID=139415 RepID=UPI0020076970|nr:uncharacterized protein B0H18DRAFT_626292 [Neoantrodia serialis]KAH9919725.1 hypothetical protein B0H18DRAFT_626292 [Neoantrodia serialis]